MNTEEKRKKLFSKKSINKKNIDHLSASEENLDKVKDKKLEPQTPKFMQKINKMDHMIKQSKIQVTSKSSVSYLIWYWTEKILSCPSPNSDNIISDIHSSTKKKLYLRILLHVLSEIFGCITYASCIICMKSLYQEDEEPNFGAGIVLASASTIFYVLHQTLIYSIRKLSHDSKTVFVEAYKATYQRKLALSHPAYSKTLNRMWLEGVSTEHAEAIAEYIDCKIEVIQYVISMVMYFPITLLEKRSILLVIAWVFFYLLFAAISQITHLYTESKKLISRNEISRLLFAKKELLWNLFGVYRQKFNARIKTRFKNETTILENEQKQEIRQILNYEIIEEILSESFGLLLVMLAWTCARFFLGLKSEEQNLIPLFFLSLFIHRKTNDISNVWEKRARWKQGLRYFNCVQSQFSEINNFQKHTADSVLHGKIEIMNGISVKQGDYTAEQNCLSLVLKKEYIATQLLIDSSETLSDIKKVLTLHINPGSTTSIIGKKGCREINQLFDTLRGLSLIKKGKFVVSGEVAYLHFHPSQFIEKCSIRDNILCGRHFNQDCYDHLIKYIELDLLEFPLDDSTIIDLDSHNLTAEQGMKILLARALYTEVNIFLLDDFADIPKSIGFRKLFDRIFFENQPGKTILIHTNKAQIIKMSDSVIVANKGSIGPIQSIKAMTHDDWAAIQPYLDNFIDEKDTWKVELENIRKRGILFKQEQDSLYSLISNAYKRKDSTEKNRRKGLLISILQKAPRESIILHIVLQIIHELSLFGTLYFCSFQSEEMMHTWKEYLPYVLVAIFIATSVCNKLYLNHITEEVRSLLFNEVINRIVQIPHYETQYRGLTYISTRLYSDIYELERIIIPHIKSVISNGLRAIILLIIVTVIFLPTSLPAISIILGIVMVIRGSNVKALNAQLKKTINTYSEENIYLEQLRQIVRVTNNYNLIYTKILQYPKKMEFKFVEIERYRAIFFRYLFFSTHLSIGLLFSYFMISSTMNQEIILVYSNKQANITLICLSVLILINQLLKKTWESLYSLNLSTHTNERINLFLEEQEMISNLEVGKIGKMDEDLIHSSDFEDFKKPNIFFKLHPISINLGLNPLLKNVYLELYRGDKIAMVGGKDSRLSLLVHLIGRGNLLEATETNLIQAIRKPSDKIVVERYVLRNEQYFDIKEGFIIDAITDSIDSDLSVLSMKISMIFMKLRVLEILSRVGSDNEILDDLKISPPELRDEIIQLSKISQNLIKSGCIDGSGSKSNSNIRDPRYTYPHRIFFKALISLYESKMEDNDWNINAKVAQIEKRSPSILPLKSKKEKTRYQLKVDACNTSTEIFQKFLYLKYDEFGRWVPEPIKKIVFIVRAILKRPDLLIMDEDVLEFFTYDTQWIMQYLFNELSNSVILCKVKNLESSLNFSRVMTMKAGRMYEFGSPTELYLHKDTYFRNLVQSDPLSERLFSRSLLASSESELNGIDLLKQANQRPKAQINNIRENESETDLIIDQITKMVGLKKEESTARALKQKDIAGKKIAPNTRLSQKFIVDATVMNDASDMLKSVDIFNYQGNDESSSN